MNIDQALAQARLLTHSSTPRVDVEILLAAIIRKPRSFIFYSEEYELTPLEEVNFNNYFNRRLTGEPIAYILGKKEFWSLELVVNNQVLIPRPETELLVSTALETITAKEAIAADLGTGSGAIALALAHERPGWKIIATDVCNEALKIAEQNAQNLKLTNVEFCCGNWCTALPAQKFHALISNPPYIAPNDPHLQQSDLKFEPQKALVANDEFAAFREIISRAKDYLIPGGVLLLEHGFDQSDVVQKLLSSNDYHDIKAFKDLADHWRVVTAISH
jgi:release factor glutamine methyltransferase